MSGDNRNIPSWLLSSITEFVGEKIRIKLICGTDVLENIVNKRKNTHIIRNHGLIVVTRGEKNARQLIFDNDQLFQIKVSFIHLHKLFIVEHIQLSVGLFTG